jgi:hypothetical protein
VVWEYKFNIFQSDVPAHRIGWASPAADPETGNIYALSGGAEALALSKDGKLLWSRSLGEEWAAFTTHGGRTMSPIVDGDLVIVPPRSELGHGCESATARGARQAHGRSSTCRIPAGAPDTAYASPRIATINGLRLLIVGLGDGGSTPSSHRPAKRSGALSPPSAPSTPAWS